MNQVKTCQNCANQFTIESDDFQFYEKISAKGGSASGGKVPPPTFCPECRFQRRLAVRNERSLYKRKCDLCKSDIVAMYPAQAPFPVYCRDCWWGDAWNPLDYGVSYDFEKPFFSQYQELLNKVPRLHLWGRNMVDSPYANMAGESKNVYLSFSIVGAEDVYYSRAVDKSFRVFDSLNGAELEQCYENVDSEKNYNCKFMVRSRGCVDSSFLFDCANCRNCFLSANLRNKEFVIRNRQYSKEDYFKELAKIDFGSHAAIENLRKEFLAVSKQALHKYGNIIKSTKATGDHIYDAKNSKWCFDVHDVENVKHIYRAFNLKDCMDISLTIFSELVYEYSSGGRNGYDIKFSGFMFDGLSHSNYTDHCGSSEYLFGCIGVRSKRFCILNKQYEEDEYQSLVPKIIDQMNTQPFTDKRGRIYRYGEFFPIEISPFAYNESVAPEYFPLTKEQVLKEGYKWREPEAKGYKPTLVAGELKDNIKEISEDILKENIGCLHQGGCEEQCSIAFRITPQELQFYKKMNLSIPRLCPNCRHYERLKLRNPINLWHRACQCAGRKSEAPARLRVDEVQAGGRNSKSETNEYMNTASHFHGDSHCPNEFETSYAPERPEVVYCESCYNNEVV